MSFDPRKYLLDKDFRKSKKIADAYFNEEGISMKFFRTGDGREMISIVDLTKNWNNRHMANIRIPATIDKFEEILYYVSVEINPYMDDSDFYY